LAPYQFGGKYTDDVWVESPEKTYDSLGMDSVDGRVLSTTQTPAGYHGGFEGSSSQFSEISNTHFLMYNPMVHKNN